MLNTFEATIKQLTDGWWRENAHLRQALANRLVRKGLAVEMAVDGDLVAITAARQELPEWLFRGVERALPSLLELTEAAHKTYLYVKALRRLATLENGTPRRKEKPAMEAVRAAAYVRETIVARMVAIVRFADDFENKTRQGLESENPVSDIALDSLAEKWIVSSCAEVAGAERPCRGEAAVAYLQAGRLAEDLNQIRRRPGLSKGCARTTTSCESRPFAKMLDGLPVRQRAGEAADPLCAVGPKSKLAKSDLDCCHAHTVS